MIGLDTNVLVRYIAQDDPTQSPRAVKFIETECSTNSPGFVGLITLVELVWVCESCYEATKPEVIAIIRQLLSIRQLQVEEVETVWKALKLFEAGSADFADCLVERVAQSVGCTATYTFDRKAAKAGMTLLK